MAADKKTIKEYNKREVDSYINQIKKSTLSFIDSSKLTARALQIISDTLARVSTSEKISKEVLTKEISSDYKEVISSNLEVVVDKFINNNYYWHIKSNGTEYDYTISFEYDILTKNGSEGTIIIEKDNSSDNRYIDYITNLFYGPSSILVIDDPNYTSPDITDCSPHSSSVSKITTATNHNLIVDDIVHLDSMGGLTGASNINFYVTEILSNTEFLIDVELPDVYTSGGTVERRYRTLFIDTTANSITVYKFKIINNKVYLSREPY